MQTVPKMPISRNIPLILLFLLIASTMVDSMLTAHQQQQQHGVVSKQMPSNNANGEPDEWTKRLIDMHNGLKNALNNQPPPKGQPNSPNFSNSVSGGSSGISDGGQIHSHENPIQWHNPVTANVEGQMPIMEKHGETMEGMESHSLNPALQRLWHSLMEDDEEEEKLMERCKWDEWLAAASSDHEKAGGGQGQHLPSHSQLAEVRQQQQRHLAKDGKRKRPIINNHNNRMDEMEEFDDFDEDEDEAQRAKERKRRNKNSANQREAANTLKNTIGCRHRSRKEILMEAADFILKEEDQIATTMEAIRRMDPQHQFTQTQEAIANSHQLYLRKIQGQHLHQSMETNLRKKGQQVKRKGPKTFITHSEAERIRRGKISEAMQKLEQLLTFADRPWPNNKPTNLNVLNRAFQYANTLRKELGDLEKVRMEMAKRIVGE